MKNEKGLMELVETCGKFEVKNMSFDKVGLTKKQDRMTKLGFKRVGVEMIHKISEKDRLVKLAEHSYIVVRPQDIRNFLSKKVLEYNKLHPEVKKSRESSGLFGSSGWTVLADRVVSAMNGDVRIDHNTDHIAQRPDAKTEIDKSIIFVAPTNDYNNTEKGTIGQYRWTETPIADYKALPPDDALKALEKDQMRGLMDEYTIASVSEIKDPILFGRIKGHEERFFITQWGDDVNLDDLI